MGSPTPITYKNIRKLLLVVIAPKVVGMRKMQSICNLCGCKKGFNVYMCTRCQAHHKLALCFAWMIVCTSSKSQGWGENKIRIFTNNSLARLISFRLCAETDGTTKCSI